MAVKTFYFLNTTALAPNYFGSVQEDGTAPAGALSTFGWTVAKIATSTPFWRGRIGASARSTAAQAASYIDSTSAPAQGTGNAATTAGDSFRTFGLSGTFAAGNWTFTIGMRTGAATHSGRVRIHVWKSANPTGASATKLNSAAGTLVGSTITLNSTTTTFNSTITWNAPSITLNDEQLFFQVEWNTTTAGTSNSCTAQFYAANVVTTNFVSSIDVLSPSDLTSPAPVLEEPTCVHLVTSNDLDADALVAPAPTLGAATLSQDHEIVANNLTSPAPVLANATLSQLVVLPPPLSITTAAPVLATPSTFTQKHLLLDVDLLTPAPVFTAPTLTLVTLLKLGDRVLDYGLAALDTEADRIYICNNFPTTYTEATSTFALGQKNFGVGLVFTAPNSGPENRFDWSEDFTQPYWGNPNIIANATTAPDGLVTADKVIYGGAFATEPSGVAGVNTYSIYLKAAECQEMHFEIYSDAPTYAHSIFGSINLTTVSVTAYGAGDDTVVDSGIEAAPNGFYRVWITYSTLATGGIQADMMPSDDDVATDGFYAWGAQLNRGTLISYIKTPVASANLIDYSEDFTNPYWDYNFSLPESNVTTAPDGTLTADKLLVGGTGNEGSPETPGAAGVFTASAYFKAAEIDAPGIEIYTDADPLGYNNTVWVEFDLGTVAVTETGSEGDTSVVDSGLEAAANGFYRCWVTFTTSNPDPQIEIYLYPFSASGSNGIYVWGAQLNSGALIPYVKTPGEATATGRVVVSNPVSGGTVSVAGAPQCWAVVDSVNSRLLAIGPASGFTAVSLSWAWTLGQIPIHMDG